MDIIKISKSWVKKLVILILLSFLYNYSFPVGPGDPLFPLALRNSNGDIISLFTLVTPGPSVISFFSHDCVNCLPEIAHLQELKKNNPSLNVFLVATDGTDVATSVSFLSKVTGGPVTLPVYYDRFITAKQAFGITALPSLFMVTRKGKIFFTSTGYSKEKGELIDAAVIRLMEETGK